MNMITLEANGLSKVYTDGTKHQTTVFRGLSVSFERGKLYAVFGPSGSGKTTLLNLLGVLDSPDEGSLKIAGQEVSAMTQDQMADVRRDRIGFVFQNHYLNPKLPVLQNLELPLRINKKVRSSEYKKRIIDILSLFGVETLLNRYPYEISGGEQQRVCIARALMNDPDIILADEPTGNLDEENERIVMECLRSLTAQDKTVVIVTHNEAVKAYADVVYYLKGGELTEVSSCR